jgi:hypothetical protein
MIHLTRLPVPYLKVQSGPSIRDLIAARGQ